MKFLFRSQTDESILRQINVAVDADFLFYFIFEPKFFGNRTVLKDGDIKTYTRYEWEINFLIKKQFWFKTFGVLAKLIQPIFGVMMNSVHTEILDLIKNNIAHQRIFNETFYPRNYFFPFFAGPEMVAHGKWFLKIPNIE